MAWWQRDRSLVNNQVLNKQNEKITALEKKVAMQEIDIALLTDKLTKAVTRKAIKKMDPEEEKDNSKNPVLLPI